MDNYIKFDSIGSDPEFFIKKGNDYFPAENFTNGTKDIPEQIINNKGYSILLDNLTLEGNVPYSTNRKDFISSIQNLKNIMKNRLALFGEEYSLVSTNTAKFKPRFLRSQQANEVGCAPDYNVFKTFSQSERLMSLRKYMLSPYRTAGFHIHIGFSGLKGGSYYASLSRTLVTTLFDYFVINYLERESGSNEIEDNLYRKKLYGIGDFYGFYRTKLYGVECRGLGSFFTQDKYLGIIYDRVQEIFNYINSLSSPEYQNILALMDKHTYPDDIKTMDDLESFIIKSNRSYKQKITTKKTIYA